MDPRTELTGELSIDRSGEREVPLELCEVVLGEGRVEAGRSVVRKR
jgi:hypothetical protein